MPPSPLDLLRGTPFADYTASATKLTGGMISYVWRMANSAGKTIVVKYADSTIAAALEVKFSIERMDFEVRGLALFNDLPETLSSDEALRTIHGLGKELTLTSSVRIPKLLYYDRSKPFLILEDIGDHLNYENWCLSTDKPAADVDIDFVCSKIGEWLAHLHAFGYANFDALKEYFVNQPARDLLGELFFEMTAKSIVEHTSFDDKQKMVESIQQFRAEKLEARACQKALGPHTLLFGDMWPGSVLFDIDARVVNLLDFEFADIGLIYGDIAHFVAHLLPMHFLRVKPYNPSTDSCPHSVVAFLSSYKQTMQQKYPAAYNAVTKDAVRHSTIFFGIEITRDVLTGNWCRCKKNTPKTDAPLKCECADILLPFARKYILNTKDSLFNVLTSE
ncbi:hypothetical protein GGI04_004547 [Coemansia thaxteri]|nr:hypothetical protein GGI04_004547 [Coemansia thaxteri]